MGRKEVNDLLYNCCMPILNQTDILKWAMLAAYIDSEGTIRISSHARFHGRGASPRHFLTVVVTNTDVLLMQWLKTNFGACVFEVNAPKRNRRLYRWMVNSRQAETVIRGCLPFFVIKRRQAELALAFASLPVNKRGVKVSPELLATREDFRQRMKDVNATGNSPAVIQ